MTDELREIRSTAAPVRWMYGERVMGYISRSTLRTRLSRLGWTQRRKGAELVSIQIAHDRYDVT